MISKKILVILRYKSRKYFLSKWQSPSCVSSVAPLWVYNIKNGFISPADVMCHSKLLLTVTMTVICWNVNVNVMYVVCVCVVCVWRTSDPPLRGPGTRCAYVLGLSRSEFSPRAERAEYATMTHEVHDVHDVSWGSRQEEAGAGWMLLYWWIISEPLVPHNKLHKLILLQIKVYKQS